MVEGGFFPTQPNARQHTGILNYQPPRFSVFLNRRRMGESTPAQRLRALRALRNHNRNGGGAASSAADASGGDAVRSTSDPTNEHASRSNRVSRFFSRSQSRATTPPPPVLATPITTATAPHTAEPSRNISTSNDLIQNLPPHH